MQEFYTLEVRSLDWLPVLTRLITRFDKDGKNTTVTIEPDGSMVTYSLRRDVIPADALAASIGSTADKVQSVPRIILKAFKQEGWQVPTVDYYGLA